MNKFSAVAFAAFQFLLPHHFLSRIVYRLARLEGGSVTRFFIRKFIALYGVDMQLAAEPDASKYRSFNAFFTRELKAGVRSQPGDNFISSPVDGSICELGSITAEGRFNAKGHRFTLTDLLGSHPLWADEFMGGKFCTLYLSPKDYHRVHCPVDASLQETVYIPGRLFSVGPSTVETIGNVFSKNERLVCRFESDAGPMIAIFVGAMFVSGIETIWAGEVTPTSTSVIEHVAFSGRHSWDFQQGDEMGRFNMGSTVIVMFARHAVEWLDKIRPGDDIKMGQALAEVRSRSDITKKES